MKTKLTKILCVMQLVLVFNCSLFSQCSVSISGGTCAGNTLNASFTGNTLAYLQWKLNGTPVYTNVLGWKANAEPTVIGGHGAGSGLDQLDHPLDVFVTASGNVYVADGANSRIQLWLPGATSGVTVAGGNGSGNNANQLSTPNGIFVDPQGNIYVSDELNNRIQKWAPGAGSGITVAGGNGFGSAANQFKFTAGIYVDASGNIYVADEQNNRIQKWAPGASSGITVAGGNGQGSDANQFSTPYSVTFDASGNMYVADGANNRVQKWAPGATSGVTVAGGNGGGSGANQLSFAARAIVDGLGNVYVVDYGNNRIQKWAPGAASGITVAGGNGAGGGANQFSAPYGISISATGNMYVADQYNARVQKFAPVMNSQYIPTAAGVYSVIASGLDGCTTASGNSINVSSSIPVQPGNINGTNSNLCGGGSFIYKIATVPNATYYTWTVPVGATLVAGQGSKTIKTNLATNFSGGNLSVTANNGCGSSMPTTRTLSTAPDKPSAISGTSFVSSGQAGLVYSVLATTGLTYTWTVPAGASITAGQGTASVTVTWGATTGNITVTASNTCGTSAATSKKVTVTNFASSTTQISDQKINDKNNKNIVVYPNPATNIVTVLYRATQQSKYELELTDVTGKVLLRKEGALFIGENKIPLDVTHYVNGTYIINLIDDENGGQSIQFNKQ